MCKHVEIAMMFNKTSGKWVPICNDIKHSVSQNKCKLVSSVSHTMRRDIECIRLYAMKHHILFQIFRFCLKQNRMLSESPQKIEQNEEFFKVDRTVEELRDKVSKLEAITPLSGYRFIENLKIKLNTVCKKLERKMFGTIGKYYLKSCKGHISSNTKAMVKVEMSKKKLAAKLKAYQQYKINQSILSKNNKLDEIDELKSKITNNYGSLRKRI